MSFMTTKQRFLELRERAISDLQAITVNDADGYINYLRSLLDEIIGEEYRSQFPEQELHILNSLLKTIDTYSFVLSAYAKNSNAPVSLPPKTQNGKVLVGAAIGSIVGTCISLLLFPKVSTLLSGAIVIGSAFGGHVITKRTQLNTNRQIKPCKPDIEGLLASVEQLCERIDSFMAVCNNQLERSRR